MSRLDPREAAKELLARREARKSLIRFTEYTYPRYTAAPHHKQLAHELEGVMRGEVDRLMLMLPPRHGKSEIASRRFPGFYLGHFPDRQLISVSATAPLAEDFGRDVRNLISGQEYGNLFPNVHLAADSKAKGKWNTADGGSYYSVGIGGSILGRGAHVALIDDPFASFADADSAATRKEVWDWYQGSLYNRLMPGGSIIIVGHRMHSDDLQGRLISQMRDGGDKWRIVKVPALDASGAALWPEWYSAYALSRIKANTAPRIWSALYQQEPVVEGGGIYRAEWWREWPHKQMPDIKYLLQVWDTAYGSEEELSDFNACTVWGLFDDPTDARGRPALILLGLFHERMAFPELRAQALDWYRQWDDGPSGPVDQVLIESKASGKSLIQELQLKGVPVMPWTPERTVKGREQSQITAASAASTLLYAGRVYYPAGRRWAQQVIDECAQLPYGAHDDIASTVTMALIWMRRTTGMIIQGEPGDHIDSPTDEEIIAQRKSVRFDEQSVEH